MILSLKMVSLHSSGISTFHQTNLPSRQSDNGAISSSPPSSNHLPILPESEAVPMNRYQSRSKSQDRSFNPSLEQQFNQHRQFEPTVPTPLKSLSQIQTQSSSLYPNPPQLNHRRPSNTFRSNSYNHQQTVVGNGNGILSQNSDSGNVRIPLASSIAMRKVGSEGSISRKNEDHSRNYQENLNGNGGSRKIFTEGDRERNREVIDSRYTSSPTSLSFNDRNQGRNDMSSITIRQSPIQTTTPLPHANGLTSPPPPLPSQTVLPRLVIPPISQSINRRPPTPEITEDHPPPIVVSSKSISLSLPCPARYSYFPLDILPLTITHLSPNTTTPFSSLFTSLEIKLSGTSNIEGGSLIQSSHTLFELNQEINLNDPNYLHGVIELQLQLPSHIQCSCRKTSSISVAGGGGEGEEIILPGSTRVMLGNMKLSGSAEGCTYCVNYQVTVSGKRKGFGKGSEK